jgi:4-amino-4-deoxy-L-arabinose transferase-like glycosyltransferase
VISTPALDTSNETARRWLLTAVAVIAAMTVLRIVWANLIELRTDEAYYWTWSQEHVLSYLDHPPMVAWFIRIGTTIFGDTNFGVRFAGIVAMLCMQLLLADIVRRVTHDWRAIVFALLFPEAALYYGLLMAKVAPDTALIPFAVATIWSLVRLAESGDRRWWLAAGVFGGLSLLSKFTGVLLVPAVLAFMLVPDWRLRQLRSPYPWTAALIALVIFSPVLIWNYQHDWATFRFQSVRATTSYGLSLRTFGDFIGLQLGLVGFVLFPVVLVSVALTAWRGYRTREPVAILLSTAVIAPFAYFLVKSLTLRVGDTWPMFLWPAGFAAAAINVAVLPRENWRAAIIRKTPFWAKTSVVTGIGFIVIVFFYYVATPWNFISRIDPVGSEANFEALAVRVQTELDKTGATWIATTDYRTNSMLRWYFRGKVPVIEVTERGRFQGFADPGIDRIKGHPGLYVARAYDYMLPIWNLTSAKRERLEQVNRVWRGEVMDTYTLEKITGWTPELSPPPDTPFFRWRVLAGSAKQKTLASNNSRSKRRISGDVREICSDGSVSAVALRFCSSG